MDERWDHNIVDEDIELPPDPAEDLVAQTKGVECRKDIDVVDEIPGAYKSIEAVIKVQEEYGMITVEAILKQILCVKG